MMEIKKEELFPFVRKFFFSKKIKNFIVADFGQGYLFDEVIELINKSTKKKYINCQANSSNYGYNLFSKYNRSEHITCDEDEYRLVNKNATEQLSDGLIRFGKQMKNLKINNLLVTAGKNGCYHLKREKQNIKINFLESIKSNKFIDSIGSGDAFFAYYCVLSITKKFTNLEILSFCHLSASMHCENFANSKYINKKDFLKSLKYFTKIS